MARHVLTVNNIAKGLRGHLLYIFAYVIRLFAICIPAYTALVILRAIRLLCLIVICVPLGGDVYYSIF